MRQLVAAWCLLCVISLGNALECFKCVNQADNYGKCTDTTYTCEPFQDTCLSLVEWRIPPYWTKHGERMHRISKTCSTASECKDFRSQLRTKCKRDWYNDWSCIECCTGDLCNYYVTLGSGITQSSVFMVLATSVVAMILRVFH